MTSDDTHAATQKLLADNSHFGAAPHQIHLLKQEKVINVHTPLMDLMPWVSGFGTMLLRPVSYATRHQHSIGGLRCM
jgi:hypothetical protein